MRLKREHHEKSILDRKHKRLKNVDSIKDAFIFVLRSQKSIFPDTPFVRCGKSAGAKTMVIFGEKTDILSGM